jgi:hypothetical protein
MNDNLKKENTEQKVAQRLSEVDEPQKHQTQLMSSVSVSNRGLLQRRVINQVKPDIVPPTVQDVLHTTGQPLDPTTRVTMESRFGHDFGHVRVHADPAAASAASRWNAHAFTLNHNIHFGVPYAPSTPAGEALLAHELTHVIQADAAVSNPVLPSSSVDALEREARQVTAAFRSGDPVPPVRGLARGLAVPLRESPDDPGVPTFGNIPEDLPASSRRVELIEEKGKWYEIDPGRTRERFTAKGRYNFVVQDGRKWAVRASRRVAGWQPGHTEAAGGRRVTFAGQIRFSGRGVLREWDNASGHYAPARAFAKNAGLPMDLFVPYSGPPAERGPQLPTFQPGKGDVLEPPRGIVQRPGSAERVPSGKIVSGEITTPSASAPPASDVAAVSPVRQSSPSRALSSPAIQSTKPTGPTGRRILRNINLRNIKVTGKATLSGFIFGLMEGYLRGKIVEIQVEREINRQLDAQQTRFEELLEQAPVGPPPYYAPQTTIYANISVTIKTPTSYSIRQEREHFPLVFASITLDTIGVGKSEKHEFEFLKKGGFLVGDMQTHEHTYSIQIYPQRGLRPAQFTPEEEEQQQARIKAREELVPGAFAAWEGHSLIKIVENTHWSSNEERLQFIANYIRYARQRPDRRALYVEAFNAYAKELWTARIYLEEFY